MHLLDYCTQYYLKLLKGFQNEMEAVRAIRRIPLKVEGVQTWQVLLSDEKIPFFLRKCSAIQYCVRYTLGRPWSPVAKYLRTLFGEDCLVEKTLHMGAALPLPFSSFEIAHYMFDIPRDESHSSVSFAVGPKGTVLRHNWEKEGIKESDLNVKYVDATQHVDRHTVVRWLGYRMFHRKSKIVKYP